MKGFTACAAECTSSVKPSGADLATTPAPIVPPAPARLSMMTGWPHNSASFCPTVRARMSVALPAVNGTTMRTGLLG